MVKNSASNVLWKKKPVICNRKVKCWDKKPKDASRVMREAYARSTSNVTTVEWEEYAMARNKVKKVIREEDEVMERRNLLNRQRL